LGVTLGPPDARQPPVGDHRLVEEGTTVVAPNVNVLIRPCEARNPRGEMVATTLSASARSCFFLLPLGISLSGGPPLILLCTGSIPLSNHGAVTIDVGGSELSGPRHPSVLAHHRVIVISPLLLKLLIQLLVPRSHGGHLSPSFPTGSQSRRRDADGFAVRRQLAPLGVCPLLRWRSAGNVTGPRCNHQIFGQQRSQQ